MFSLLFTEQAIKDYQAIKTDHGLKKRFKAVRKALGFLEVNPKHPSLNTHKYLSVTGANGEDIFEAYAENKTPAAYRIFWHYGPGKNNISIIAITITSHP